MFPCLFPSNSQSAARLCYGSLARLRLLTLANPIRQSAVWRHRNSSDTGGSLFTEEIRTAHYRTLDIRVAFATSSGTSRLFGPIREFVQRAGTAVVHIGLSNGITSAQAAEQLLLAGASVFGFETGGSVLFHPKVYLLQGRERVWISIGSSNLTSDGLYRNFEANSLTTFDPQTQANRAALRELTDAFRYLDAIQGASRRISASDLPDLIASNALIDETLVPVPQRVPSVLRTTRRVRGEVVRIRVPAAPPQHLHPRQLSCAHPCPSQ